MGYLYGHSVAKIKLSAIKQNCLEIRKHLPVQCKICVAVKCDAYGHGIEIVLPVFKSINIDMLAVATIDESRHLRKRGWVKPILILGSEFSIYKGKQKKEIANWLIVNGIRIMLMNRQDLKFMVNAAETQNIPAKVHLKLDSGMSRMGLREDDLFVLALYAQKYEKIIIEGLCTHLSSADEASGSFSEYQIKRFLEFSEKLKKYGINIPLLHVANSAGVVNLKCSYNMVRPGIAVYGYNPDFTRNDICLHPCMQVVSFLTLVKKVKAGDYLGYGCSYQASKEMTIGIVPIGYGDGYDRQLSNRGVMTIKGIKVPVVGRISMDQTIIDLSNIVNRGLNVCIGMEVTVIDDAPGASNSVESIAEQLDTIPYEIVTRLGPRIRRISV
jgi:alanine racemase